VLFFNWIVPRTGAFHPSLLAVTGDWLAGSIPRLVFLDSPAGSGRLALGTGYMALGE